MAGKVSTAVKTELSFLAADRLVSWLEALSSGETQVLVPSKPDGTFVPWQGDEPDLRGITATSAKSLVLPQHETFLSYKYQEGGSVEVTPVVDEAERVVFGARLCDMHGLLCIDQTFGESGPSGGDPNYMARRARTTLVSVACTEADVDGACFCATFFTPDSFGAADAVVHPVEGGYVLRPLSEKGERVVELAAGAGASTTSVPEALPPAQGSPIEIKGIEEKLLAVFNDDDLWNDVTESCLSCGACSFVCPTCYCFSITDEARGSDCGDRVRCWDSCGFACYTKEASGHNPRSRNAKRFRNRVNHKFTYYPELYNLESCVGCGRCVRACPAAVDIRDMVEAVMAR